MYKNQDNQYVFASVVDSSDSSAKTSGVDFHITKDDGSQASVDSATHIGNGQWRIDLTEAETNADVIGICWSGSDVVPGNITLYPVEKKVQDYQNELDSIGDIKAKTDELEITDGNVHADAKKVAGQDPATENDIRDSILDDSTPFNGADVGAAKTAAESADGKLPADTTTRLERMDADVSSRSSHSAADAQADVSGIEAVTDKLDTTLQEDGENYKFTQDALQEAPTGGDGVWNTTQRDKVINDAESAKTAAESADGKLPSDTTTKLNRLDADVSSRSSHSANDAKADVSGLAEKTDLPANFGSLGINSGGDILKVVENDDTPDISGLAEKSDITSLQSHGDSEWQTATGFSTHSANDVKNEVEASGSKLDDVHGRATEARLAKLDVSGDLANTDNANDFKAEAVDVDEDEIAAKVKEVMEADGSKLDYNFVKAKISASVLAGNIVAITGGYEIYDVDDSNNLIATVLVSDTGTIQEVTLAG